LKAGFYFVHIRGGRNEKAIRFSGGVICIRFPFTGPRQFEGSRDGPVLRRYPQGRFHPYLGFGLGVSSVDVSGTRTQQILGSTVTQPLNDSDTSFAYQILLGVNYEINKNWSADLTYRWFGTDPQIHGGDVDYTTNMITVGVNYHF
jgi:hypothetical protein